VTINLADIILIIALEAVADATTPKTQVFELFCKA
jgi:hypothetical protein